MEIKDFVTYIKGELTDAEFAKVCKMARDGEMGFGPKYTDWGTADGKG